MEMVTIPKKEYERLKRKAAQDDDFAAELDEGIAAAEKGVFRRR